MGWREAGSCLQHSTPLHSPITVGKAHFLWRLTGLGFWCTNIKVKVVTTSEMVQSKSKYQALVWKETAELLINDRSLDSMLSVFNIEIFLTNVSTTNTKRWSEMMWELNLMATHWCILLFYPVKWSLSYTIALSHTIHSLLSVYI